MIFTATLATCWCRWTKPKKISSWFFTNNSYSTFTTLHKETVFWLTLCNISWKIWSSAFLWDAWISSSHASFGYDWTSRTAGSMHWWCPCGWRPGSPNQIVSAALVLKCGPGVPAEFGGRKAHRRPPGWVDGSFSRQRHSLSLNVWSSASSSFLALR